jgi:F-type H+-transporting ATPase subunit delta
MLNTSIALRYARALHKIGKTTGTIKKVVEDVSGISKTIDTTPYLKRVLYHPAITADEKKSVLREVFAKLCDPVSLDFVSYLIEKKRIFVISAIAQCLIDLLTADENKINVKVESFQELPGESIKKIKDLLSKRLSKEIVLSTEVVPSLLGGMRVILGDRVIDGSISHQLHKLSDSITSF